MSNELSPEDVAEIEQFAAHVEDLQARYGVDLTDEGKQALVDEVFSNGFTPGATEQAFAGIAAEAEEEDAAEAEDAPEDEALEQHPLEQQYEEQVTVPEQFIADIGGELKALEGKLDRKLSRRELSGIEEQMGREMRLRGEVNVEAALNAHYEDQGRSVPDMDKRTDRVAHMTERMADDAADDASPTRPGDFDLDTHQGRVDYAAHRLAGGEPQDDTESGV